MSPEVIELREYTLHPDQRDVLIALFDREFVKTQEAVGIRVLGQFRDLDRPDRFVWLRAFPSMAARATALAAFYGGPAWKAHRVAANATMIDSDNVLLLRPACAAAALFQPSSSRENRVTLATTVCLPSMARLEEFSRFFEDALTPVLEKAGLPVLASLKTEYSPNNFPALPVREGEHAFVWFSAFLDPQVLGENQKRLETSPQWRSVNALCPLAFRLSPTAASKLRG